MSNRITETLYQTLKRLATAQSWTTVTLYGGNIRVYGWRYSILMRLSKRFRQEQLAEYQAWEEKQGPLLLCGVCREPVTVTENDIHRTIEILEKELVDARSSLHEARLLPKYAEFGHVRVGNADEHLAELLAKDGKGTREERDLISRRIEQIVFGEHDGNERNTST